jgi:hypothetical protein
VSEGIVYASENRRAFAAVSDINVSDDKRLGDGAETDTASYMKMIEWALINTMEDAAIAGNIRALQQVYRTVARYWRQMLCSRSWAGRRLTWSVFNQLQDRTPLLRPKLHLPYRALQALAGL